MTSTIPKACVSKFLAGEELPWVAEVPYLAPSGLIKWRTYDCRTWDDAMRRVERAFVAIARLGWSDW